VFPIKHLRALTRRWPGPRYLNLYGPTETNVCTCFELPEIIPKDQEDPFPIGRACAGLEVRVADAAGQELTRGQTGELQVVGPGVTRGYWNAPEQTAAAFTADGWYKTGDLVYTDDRGELVFVGRRDRMVKRRGYRIELGELEAALYLHDAIEEAAVVAFPSEHAGVRLTAFLVCSGEQRPSLLAIKRFCSEHLPLYMLPDHVEVLASMPKTSTDKIDLQRLRRGSLSALT
jgi:acyl-CoA synthetase (AMP-forming)/AMP-acid ligase II